MIAYNTLKVDLRR